ncbi:MAG: type II toxin-antitoxin system death-on-curing family toxin, partial [Minwuia sp.]|nr:type II toxin-antitoxin system death-on-curing family toxin [Minwuia sp.]
MLRSVVEAVHDAQLAEHGGLPGLRDPGLLESALARPRNSYSYGETEIRTLAASYAFGIARNHPFVDGNKRMAFLSAYVFLRLNGWQMKATEAEATTVILSLAAGSMSESDFANWLCNNSVEIG